MDTKALRQKILDLAIRGKLVPQDPSDEPASVLLERIRSEKERLIAEGKIKRHKKSKASSSEFHYQNFTPPFPIPDSWQWVRLEEIGEIITGNTPSKDIKSYYGGNIPFYKPTDLDQGINTSHASDTLSDEGYNISRKIPTDSVLVTCIGATIGKTGRILNEGSCNQQINAIIPVSNVLSKFLYFVCVSDYFQSEIKKNASATTLPILNKNNFSLLYMPLPPQKEQERIVEKIEHLRTIVDCVDLDCKLLGNTISSAKSKILELAMQGKLVPQDPADEPAADMLRRINPKARIITDNPHYPKWLCSYLGDICGFERGITFPSDAKRFDKVPGYIACLRTANVHDEVDLSSLWYISEEYLKGNDAKKLKAGDILMSTANSKELVGRSVIIRNLSEPATFGGFVTVLRTQILLPEFFSLFLKYKTLKGYFSKIATQTTNIANLNTKILSTVITPIPPRVEQSRIIQRVNQLFSVLDEIEASLQSSG